ncbi:acyltransferase 3 [Penicillium atrosanguineum]|nr:acyltransferase 3 [Penicillium atrosanguineum]KAJ5119327.1 acyltransferase 3 [Penicillium atrosanguineum]
MGRVLWLDGLRGVASAIVAVYHFKTYEPKAVFGFLASSYWDDPREENRRLLQLPLSGCYSPVHPW